MLVTAFNFTPIGLLVNGIRVGMGAVRRLMSWSPSATLSSAWAFAPGFFGGLASRFFGFGRNVVQGLVNGIRSGAGAVRDATVGTAGQAVTWFKNRLGIRSPSRVFMGLGGDTMAGLAGGLEQGGRSAVARVAAIGGAMITAAAAGSLAPPAWSFTAPP